MKKRSICLFLAAVMLVATFLSSCSLGGSGEETNNATDDVIKEASNSTMTLSMFVVAEKPVSEETAALVNKEFNKITKSAFKTQVCLHFVTYDEYYKTIEGRVQANADREELAKKAANEFKIAKQEAKAEGIATDKLWEDQWYAAHPDYIEFRVTEELTGEDTTAEETILVTVEGAEDYTISEIKYPQEKDYQLDIIWIDSYDRYMEYIEKDWLSRLDDELSGGSKKLKEYISPALLAWTKWSSSGTYAIPNNAPIGQYTYMLLNKKLVEKYNYNPETITGIYSEDCGSFLADIAKYEPDYAPVLGEIPVTNTIFWSYDAETNKVYTDKFNLMGDSFALGRTLDPSVTTNAPASAKSIMTVSAYTDQLKTIQKFKDAGYIKPEGSTDKFAVKIVKGGAELEKKYGDDYYLNILEYPRVTEEDIFSSMFAVTTFTRSVRRSMQIVTYLNTNSDLRNVLQYGVENTHYVKGLDGVVQRLNDDYMMNLRHTGNEFVAAPEEGMDPDIWTYGKKQNIDVKAGLLNCFRVPLKYIDAEAAAKEKVETMLDKRQIENINRASEQIYEKIQNAASLEELEKIIDQATSTESTAVRNQISPRNASVLYSIYYEWVQDMRLYIPTED